jgi:hypothetical protein
MYILSEARKYSMAFLFVFLFLALASTSAFSTLYTIDAKDDAGEFPGQAAYAPQFLDSKGVVLGTLSSQPASAANVYAAAQGFSDWSLHSAGNIWSMDTIVGDSYHFSAGTYRIDAVRGGFLYNSFGPDWGNVYDSLWSVNITAQVDGSAYTDTTTLGTFFAKDVGTVPLYTYVTLSGPGSLDFWIYDWNSIDNSGSLTFSITSVPEPSTFPFLAGVFSLLLVPRVRRYLAR